MRYLERTTTIIGGLGLFAAVSLGAYLFASGTLLRFGFPLDDAWIHQTYARNLGIFGAWEFLPGQPSAGSTAPAWTLLLSFGYWLGVNKFAWTFFLGWILLWALGVAAACGYMSLAPGKRRYAFFTGLVVIFEWHLVWAAGSGMETSLAALVALVGLVWVIRISRRQDELAPSMVWNWFALGILIGIGAWVRPDLITLLGVAGLTLLLSRSENNLKIRNAVWITAGFMLAALPYILFNLQLSGEIWPNTFFAKQSEYAILRSFPIWQRFLSIAKQPLTGIGILILPGFFWFGYRRLLARRWAEFFSFCWIFIYLLVYSARLPVTYQHGRYIMPVLPLLCVLGVVGVLEMLERISNHQWSRILRPAWLLSGAAVLTIFWILGIQAYALDVAVIESEMVATAYWVAENTEASALIAAHDIGALGYYGDRNIIDLAGLVSPEVIPFIRDEAALEEFIKSRDADYLVTFPGWYPHLVVKGDLVYQSNYDFSPSQGGENMAVYRWRAH